jgi:hypothetical protein
MNREQQRERNGRRSSPVMAEISCSSISSRKRMMKTIRCFGDRDFNANWTRLACSPANVRVSGDGSWLASADLASVGSTAVRPALFQKCGFCRLSPAVTHLRSRYQSSVRLYSIPVTKDSDARWNVVFFHITFALE